MTVFVDTSAFLAYLDHKDQNNGTAVNIFERLYRESESLICTNYVLLESFALVQNRLGMVAARDLQDSFVPLLQIKWVDESLHQAGLTAWLAANRRRLSLVDCTSFEAMRRLNIDKAFAFDQHFVEQGFTCLEADE